MVMISHHRMRDNCNGPDRVIEYIFTRKRHKRYGYHQFDQRLFRSLLLNLMKVLVAPEDNKGPDRVSAHLYMYVHLPMRSQQPWNHKVA